MPDVITIGEALIDFVATESGLPIRNVPAFEKRLGGAPVNLAIGIASLGGSAGVIAKVGDDEFGQFLENEIKRFGVDATIFLKASEASTPLAFVSHLEGGERSFSFYNKSNANLLLKETEIDANYISTSKIFHFSTLSLAAEPSRSATWKAVDIASKDGIVISFDPNLRLNFWPDTENAEKLCRTETQRAIPKAHILRMNREEGKWITDKTDEQAVAEALHQLGPTLVVITRGGDGAFYSYKTDETGFQGEVKGIKVNSIDTTGAGDAFLARLLYRLSKRSVPILERLTQEELNDICSSANELAAKATTVRGAISIYSSFVTRDS